MHADSPYVRDMTRTNNRGQLAANHSSMSLGGAPPKGHSWPAVKAVKSSNDAPLHSNSSKLIGVARAAWNDDVKATTSPGQRSLFSVPG